MHTNNLINASYLRKDGNGEGGGVMLVIKDCISALVVDKDISHGEGMWVSVNNGRVNIRIGVVYNPQESRVNKECAKAKHQHILLMGDMNCKVGDAVRGNKSEATVGGKMLKKMVKNNNLIIVNDVEECKGTWTRQSGKDVSIIDYIIIKEEDRDNIRSAMRDDEKMVAPFRLKKKCGQNSYDKIYSDHNVIKITINWCGEHEQKTDRMTRKVMTTNSYEKN